MQKITKTQVEKMVKTLNDNFKADPKAIAMICEAYAICNNKLADSDGIVVTEDQYGQYLFSSIGLINGLLISCGSNWRIAKSYNDLGNLIGFVATEYKL